jgi:uncharacterized membrane protein YfcA
MLFGLLGGTLIGSTGIGSGSLLTPLLIMAGHRPAVAVSTGLATLIVSKLTGSIAHRSLGNWPGRQGWFVIAGGVLGVTAVSSLALAGVTPSDVFVRRAVAVSLVVTAIAVWLRWRPRKEEVLRCAQDDGDWRVLFLSGAIVGGFVALTSAGSGSLLVPLLLIVTAWGVPQLAATSNVFGWIAALLAFALHLGRRSFDPMLFVLVLAGLVPGVIAGVFLSRRIDRRALAPLLSIFTLYLATQLF